MSDPAHSEDNELRHEHSLLRPDQGTPRPAVVQGRRPARRTRRRGGRQSTYTHPCGLFSGLQPVSSPTLPAIAVLICVVLVCGLFVVRGRTDFETYLLLVPAASPPLAGPLRAARRPVQPLHRHSP